MDDLGALLAVVTVNAGNIEGNRGALGILNRIGNWALLLAHRARANTVRPSYLGWSIDCHFLVVMRAVAEPLQELVQLFARPWPLPWMACCDMGIKCITDSPRRFLPRLFWHGPQVQCLSKSSCLRRLRAAEKT